MPLAKDDPKEYEKIKARIKTLIEYRDKIEDVLNNKGGLFNPRVAITAKIKEIITDELPTELSHKKEVVDEIIKRIEKEVLGAM
jgi:hypothetical protein